MERIQAFFSEVLRIIKTYDLQAILKFIHNIDWARLVKDPIAWLITALIILVIILTKRYRYIIVALSLVAFAFLVNTTIPGEIEQIELKHLLGFFVGAVAIIGIDFYLLVVKE